MHNVLKSRELVKYSTECSNSFFECAEIWKFTKKKDKMSTHSTRPNTKPNMDYLSSKIKNHSIFT